MRNAELAHIHSREQATNCGEHDASASHAAAGGQKCWKRFALQHFGHVLVQRHGVSATTLEV